MPLARFMVESTLVRIAYERGLQAGGDAAVMMRQRGEALLIRETVVDTVRELLQNDESPPDPED